MSGTEAHGPVRRPRVWRRSQRQNITFLLFIAPWLLGFAFLSIIPLVVGFLSSFTSYDGLSLANMRFIGTENYVRAFNDPDVGFSIQRTLIWGLVNVPLYPVISFSLALMLNQAIRGRGFVRTVFYLPSVVPLSAALIAWKAILDKNMGLLNGLIDIFRPGTAIGWLSNYALAGMVAISIWAGLGVGMVIFLAALQGIRDELTEAAHRRRQRSPRPAPRHPAAHDARDLLAARHGADQFFPAVEPAIAPDARWPDIAGRGAAAADLPVMIHTYEQIFTKRVYGYGNALLWVLFVAVLLLTGVVFWTQKYWVYTAQRGEGDPR